MTSSVMTKPMFSDGETDDNIISVLKDNFSQ